MPPRRWFRPPRRLRITRAGGWYIVLTLGVGAAALNTGNNLLFLVLGLLLSGIVISGLLSEWALQRIRVKRELPTVLRAGEPALVGLRVKNKNQFWSSFSLVVEDRLESGHVGGRCFFLKVGPGETRESAYALTPERRGELQLSNVRLSTQFPFGLFEKSRDLDLPAKLVAFPRRVRPPMGISPEGGRQGEQPDRHPRTTASAEGDLHGLKDYRIGDDVRLIHWKATARHRRLILAERERLRRRQVTLVVDNRGDLSDPRAVEALDRAVENAAALAERQLADGSEVGLSVSGISLPPGAGPGHARSLLSTLGLLAITENGSAPNVSSYFASVKVSG